jgi:rRNA maturation endonuclease Nob1
MNTNEQLDASYPAACYACKTPFRRADGYVCAACGLDNRSAEAWAIMKARQWAEAGRSGS